MQTQVIIARNCRAVPAESAAFALSYFSLSLISPFISFISYFSLSSLHISFHILFNSSISYYSPCFSSLIYIIFLFLSLSLSFSFSLYEYIYPSLPFLSPYFSISVLLFLPIIPLSTTFFSFFV